MSHFFLSHAGADGELARRLNNLLQTGCDLRATEIFCTSVEGSGVSTGEQFTHRIREHLVGSDLVILLVTPMWWDRPFCVAEMGAAWAREIPVFPLVLPGMTRELGANMLGTQTQELNATGLDHLRDRIVAIHPAAQTATARWNVERDIFLKELPDLLAKVRQPDKVDRTDLDASRAEVAVARQMVQEARTEQSRLQEHIRQLEELKDADDVLAVRRANSTADETYVELLAAAQESLHPLTDPERRALFGTIRGEPWRPTDEVWTFERGAMTEAVNAERIVRNGSGYDANEDDPVMEEALAAVRRLGAFLEDEAPDELLAALRSDHRVIPKVTNLRFWESVLTDRALWS